MDETRREDARRIRRTAGVDGEPALTVIAPPGIRDSVAVPMPGETEGQRRRRDELFLALLDAARL